MHWSFWICFAVMLVRAVIMARPEIIPVSPEPDPIDVVVGGALASLSLIYLIAGDLTLRFRSGSGGGSSRAPPGFRDG